MEKIMTFENINIELFQLLNAQSSASELSVKIAMILADYVIYLVPVFLVAAWLFGNNDKKEIALKSVSVALIALGIGQIIVAIYPHPRPFMIGIGRTLIEHAPDPSFPSDHMTLFSSIAITYLIGRLYKIGLTILIAGFAVGWSRVYLGVHFPFDMLGAVLISLVVAIAIQPIWKIAGRQVTDLIISIYQSIFKTIIKNGWIK